MERDQRTYDKHADAYTLRFYSWPCPTISLGRFQKPSAEFFSRLKALNIPWVYRPTGGQAILHQNDLTFSVTGPLNPSGQRDILSTYHWIAQGIITALDLLGVKAEVVTQAEPARAKQDACYASMSQADIQCENGKLVGCAQTRRRRAFLQQCVLYLRAPHTLQKQIFDTELPLNDLQSQTNASLNLETVASALEQGISAEYTRQKELLLL